MQEKLTIHIVLLCCTPAGSESLKHCISLLSTPTHIQHVYMYKVKPSVLIDFILTNAKSKTSKKDVVFKLKKNTKKSELMN